MRRWIIVPVASLLLQELLAQSLLGRAAAPLLAPSLDGLFALGGVATTLLCRIALFVLLPPLLGGAVAWSVAQRWAARSSRARKAAAGR